MGAHGRGVAAGDLDVLMSDDVYSATRRAQARSDADHTIRVNITQAGAMFHDIEGGDELEITVYTDGIWIEPADDE